MSAWFRAILDLGTEDERRLVGGPPRPLPAFSLAFGSRRDLFTVIWRCAAGVAAWAMLLRTSRGQPARTRWIGHW